MPSQGSSVHPGSDSNSRLENDSESRATIDQREGFQTGGTIITPPEADDFLGPMDDAGGCTLKLVNVTATCSVNCKLDLKNIVMRARNAEYNPKRFSACVIRLNEPKATALVFSSGKMVVTGSKSETVSLSASKMFCKIIGKLGNAVNFEGFTLQNMVATTDVCFPLRLEGLVASSHSQYCSYEPELFPGLIYRLAQPKVCLLIFVSGKVVLTGGKSIRQLREAFKLMYPVLCEFRKGTVLLDPSLSAASSNGRRVPRSGGDEGKGTSREGQGSSSSSGSASTTGKRSATGSQIQAGRQGPSAKLPRRR